MIWCDVQPFEYMKTIEEKRENVERNELLIYGKTWNIWLDADNGFFMKFWC